MFTTRVPLVLASGSPRRQTFLRELGLDFRIFRPEGQEPRPREHEDPAAYSLRTASFKAETAFRHFPEHAIIAADTIVVLEGDILGKPASEEESISMLCRLSGRMHTVITAVCLIMPGTTEGCRQHARSWTCASRVRFHNWDKSVLTAYARTGDSLDKAGGYALQGLGAFLVAEIEGSWSNVVGLPVAELTEALLEEGIIGI